MTKVKGRQAQERLYERAMNYTEQHRDIMLIELSAHFKEWETATVISIVGNVAHDWGRSFDEALWLQWSHTDKGKQTEKRMVATL